MDDSLYLPDVVLIQIFGYLHAEEILKCSSVCKAWLRVTQDELLWRTLVRRDWKLDPRVSIAPGKCSWRDEYVRLWQETPVLETEVLKGHTHQVLHVSFSHNGKYFASCSKDGYILLWDAGYPARIKHYFDMKAYSWKNTQYSQFNESDTLLLVSGVHFGTHSNTGEIAVFNIEDNFVIQCRVSNKPYDFFGTWYNDSYLLSGDLRWLAHLVSTSVVWLNRASQEVDSEFISVMNRMFKFYNRSASSIRSIAVANCHPIHTTRSPSPAAAEVNDLHGDPVEKMNRTGRHSRSTSDLNSKDVKTAAEDAFWLPEMQYRGKSSSDLLFSTGSASKSDAHNTEEDDSDGGHDSVDTESTTSDRNSALPPRGTGSQFRAGSADSEASEDVLDAREKLLIFTMGSRTYTPHQIGVKRILPFTFCNRIEVGLSLAERVAIRRQEQETGNQPPIVEPSWHDYESVADMFDKIDFVFDLNGHIIGLALSPDHRFLYVNVRPWPPGCVITNPLQPPPIAQEIDIHVIDLFTFQQVGTLFRAHRAYTSNDECFFIFLDVSDDYVASGAEDNHGYLWDRHYGVCLAQYPHADVVNSVAFNPRDPHMLITASDDFTLKIWRSRVRARRLGLPVDELTKAIEYRRRAARWR